VDALNTLVAPYLGASSSRWRSSAPCCWSWWCCSPAGRPPGPAPAELTGARMAGAWRRCWRRTWTRSTPSPATWTSWPRSPWSWRPSSARPCSEWAWCASTRSRTPAEPELRAGAPRRRRDGFVVSSLHARALTRVYGKAVTARQVRAALSEEESQALREAGVGRVPPGPADRRPGRDTRAGTEARQGGVVPRNPTSPALHPVPGPTRSSGPVA